MNKARLTGISDLQKELNICMCRWRGRVKSKHLKILRQRLWTVDTVSAAPLGSQQRWWWWLWIRKSCCYLPWDWDYDDYVSGLSGGAEDNDIYIQCTYIHKHTHLDLCIGCWGPYGLWPHRSPRVRSSWEENYWDIDSIFISKD